MPTVLHRVFLRPDLWTGGGGTWVFMIQTNNWIAVDGSHPSHWSHLWFIFSHDYNILKRLLSSSCSVYQCLACIITNTKADGWISHLIVYFLYSQKGVFSTCGPTCDKHLSEKCTRTALTPFFAFTFCSLNVWLCVMTEFLLSGTMQWKWKSWL